MARFGGTAPEAPVLDRRVSAGKCIYVVQPEDRPFVKIGSATNLLIRLGEIQCGSPERLKVLLVLPGSLRLELAIHRALSGHGVRGEWFQLTPLVQQMIELLSTAELAELESEVIAFGVQRWSRLRQRVEKNRASAMAALGMADAG